MLRVRVVDYDTIEVKPKLTQTILQYIIIAVDDFNHAETFFVDKDKYQKDKFVELVRQRFASRYRIPTSEVEVTFVVEPR